MKKGEMISVSKGSLLFVKWKDKRDVSLLTNIHDASTIVKKRRSKSGVGGYEETVKPTAIEEYNKYMSGVDRLDQFLSYYNFNHRTNKWWQKAFFCLLDIAIYNSFVLYSKSKQDHRKLSQFRCPGFPFCLDGTSSGKCLSTRRAEGEVTTTGPDCVLED